MSLMVTFDLRWPNFVYEFLSYQETAGSITGQIYSVDCVMPDVSEISMFYLKILVISSLPIVATTISVAYWLIISIKRRSMDPLK